MMFYLLSIMSGFLECGWIAYGVTHSLPMWQILCYPLAYHLGNLFPIPFSVGDKWLRFGAISSVVLSIVLLYWKMSDGVVFLLTCISIFILSACIQSLRSGLKKDVNKLAKRVFRVVGFILSPLAAFGSACMLVIISIIVMICLKGKKCESRVRGMSIAHGFSLVMIFHQLHYFFYAHITLASIGILFSLRQSIYSVFASTFFFAGTWITYMMVEPLTKKMKIKNLPLFFIGHIFVCFLLQSMSLIHNLDVFILLWLVTGLGGGVVYTITVQAKEMGFYEKTSMDIAENVGHTIGLVAAVAVSAITKDKALEIMLRLGSFSAFFTILTMIITLRKGKKHEIVNNNG